MWNVYILLASFLGIQALLLALVLPVIRQFLRCQKRRVCVSENMEEAAARLILYTRATSGEEARHITHFKSSEAYPCEAEKLSKLERDKAVLEDLYSAVRMVGWANFVTAPFIFCLALQGTTRCFVFAVVVMAARAVTSFMLQRRLVGKLRLWVTDFNDGLSDLDTRLSLIPIRASIFLAVLATVDYIDPDSDALNAGQAWHTAAATLKKFDDSWVGLPLLGPLVARLGLPSILTGIVALSLALQAIAFSRYMSFVKNRAIDGWASYTDSSWRGSGLRLDYWLNLQHACDVSSVTYVAQALHMLAKEEYRKKVKSEIADHGQVGFSHTGRSAYFRTKVLYEATPSLWFSVSLLALNYDHATWTNLVVMFGTIFTSTFTTVKISSNELLGCIETVRMDWVWRGFDDHIELGAMFRFMVLLVNTELLVASLVRMGGIWYCDSRILNLVSGCLET